MKNYSVSPHSDLPVLFLGLAALSAWLFLQAAAPPPLLGKEAAAPGAASGRTATASPKLKTKPAAKPKAKPAAKPKPEEKAESLPWPQSILTLAGDGAVLVRDGHARPGQPRELYAHNEGRFYIPASILKIVTSGAALEFLGSEFRFKTEFLLTKSDDLWVIGYGDPYLVSEELEAIVRELQKRGLKKVNNIYIDDSYFEKDLVLDGNTKTLSPFDAYNGAFSVNFNTVSFQRNQKGQTARAVPGPPLTPLALKLAGRVKGQGFFTLNIAESPLAAEINSGELLKAHLRELGVPVKGEIFPGRAAPANRKVFYLHESSINLETAVRKLMEHSNNFMANQIFLAMGAELYGPPATQEKSQAAMNFFFQNHALDPIDMGDGSGLSRRTALTARQMADILMVLEPNRYVFNRSADGLVLSKTGTMSDIKTLAGYLERPGQPDKPLSFVILLNGPGYVGVRDRILNLIKTRFLADSSGSG